MKLTSNYNLKKPEGTDVVNIDDLNGNADIIDTKLKDHEEQINSIVNDYIRSPGYGISSGNAKNYTLTLNPPLQSYVAGVCVAVKIHIANTGASTININDLGAKSIKDSKGNDLTSGKLVLNSIYTLRYDGTNFQLLGEGGEYGTATESDVLSGKTIGTDNGLIDGTMPNRGTINQNLTTDGQEYTIPGGYHSGLGKIKAVITGLVASVIKHGSTVGGIAGSFTADATATAAQILSGAIAYVNGNKITGTMPDRGTVNQTLTNQGQQFTITDGKHSGSGKVTVSIPNLIAGNIKKGANIGGVVGTYPNYSAISLINSGIYTVPDGVSKITAFIIGGGSGGECGASASARSGGAGGASGKMNVVTMNVTPGQQIIYTIGSGGVGKATVSDYNGGNQAGELGGASIFHGYSSNSGTSQASASARNSGVANSLTTNIPDNVQNFLYSGGGGGQTNYTRTPIYGATSPGGGNGGYGAYWNGGYYSDESYRMDSGSNGSTATLYGCGGGGGGGGNYRPYVGHHGDGGNGAQGVIYLTFS